MEQNSEKTAPVGLDIPVSVERLVEGLLFAASEPLSLRQIKAICEAPAADGQERTIGVDVIEQAIQNLNEQYAHDARPYRIQRIAEGYQFATLAQYAEWIGRLEREQARRKLSQSALETLAIISYKQPVSRPEIESIRGVNCDYVLKTLLEKDLITITGRAETVGRPLLYGTTREFLQHFGLYQITDLPRPREIEEILGESQFETERRMLEAQAGAEQARKEEEDFKSRLPHIPKKKPHLDETAKILPHRRRRGIAVTLPDPSQLEIPAPPSEDEPAPIVAAPEPGAEPVQEEARATSVEEGSVEPPVEVVREEPVTVAAPAPETDEPLEPEASSDAEGASAGELREALPAVNVPAAPSDEQERPAETTETNAGETGTAAVRLPEAREAGRGKTRWQAWKERLRTIIHKLFG